MNRSGAIRWTMLILLGLVVLVLGWFWLRPKPEEGVRAQILAEQPPTDLASFERVTGPRALNFPEDHGPHPDFLTEWWYYTGNLEGKDGRRFGYQLTFFRRAVQPAGRRLPRESNWAAEQVYMAHLALTDVERQDFYAFERFERGAAGLAGAEGLPLYQVWVRDWAVTQLSEDEFQLEASEQGISLSLHLTDRKGIVFQGEGGYSQKGPENGNASLYYSQTRLSTAGQVRIASEEIAVTGESWLDREISTSALSKGQVGWDWFALQLSDGSEIMAYQLRRSDGQIDPYSTATLIRPDGTTSLLKPGDFQILPLKNWRSPHSGGVYPAQWEIIIPSKQVALRITPLSPDQELNLSFTYWEGAVGISGTKNGEPITGYGYVELTGYAQSLEGGL